MFLDTMYDMTGVSDNGILFRAIADEAALHYFDMHATREVERFDLRLYQLETKVAEFAIPDPDGYNSDSNPDREMFGFDLDMGAILSDRLDMDIVEDPALGEILHPRIGNEHRQEFPDLFAHVGWSQVLSARSLGERLNRLVNLKPKALDGFQDEIRRVQRQISENKLRGYIELKSRS